MAEGHEQPGYGQNGRLCDEGKQEETEMGTSYLVEGAKLRCMCGSKCSELKVTDHGYYADGKKKANCKDCLPEINILDFGACKKNKNGKVCKGFMKLADKWENLGDASRLEKLSGHAALTMDSVLLCKKGGLIVPETSGQGVVREINWGLFLTRYGIKQAFAALGIKEGCLYGRDPVNLNTGNFLYEKEDLVIPGITKMSFHIFYNSMITDLIQYQYQWRLVSFSVSGGASSFSPAWDSKYHWCLSIFGQPMSIRALPLRLRAIFQSSPKVLPLLRFS